MGAKNHSIFRNVILMWFALILIACNSTSDTGREEPATGTPASTPVPTTTPTPLVEMSHPAYPTPPPTLIWTPELEQLKSIILGATCPEPCWFGIRPGVTPADQVPEILSQQVEEGIVEDFFLRPHPMDDRNVVRFATISEFAGAGIGIDEERNIVTYAGISPDAKFILLKDVINIYGPPQLVAIGWGDSFQGLYLAYEEPALFLWVRSDDLSATTLSAEMTLIRFEVLSPYTPNHPINAGVVTWVDWEGFQDFEYYYQKVNEAKEEG